jgi:hypothetical protein
MSSHPLCRLSTEKTEDLVMDLGQLWAAAAMAAAAAVAAEWGRAVMQS